MAAARIIPGAAQAKPAMPSLGNDIASNNPPTIASG
jgi:hypothetical protein